MPNESVLQVRLTLDQKKRLASAATASGLSLSAWGRTSLLELAEASVLRYTSPRVAAAEKLQDLVEVAATIDLPKTVRRKIQAAVDQFERRLPPAGLSKSDLQRWYRENR